jgi:hypothetical protein
VVVGQEELLEHDLGVPPGREFAGRHPHGPPHLRLGRDDDPVTSPFGALAVGEPGEVGQQGAAVLGQDRLRVELHAPLRTGAVGDAHQHAVVGPRRGGQVLREVGHGQRVVADHVEVLRQTGEQARAVVPELGDPAVPGWRAADAGAVRQGQALVPEADAEQRQFRALDDLAADAEVGGHPRIAGAGGEHHAVVPVQQSGMPVRVVVAHYHRNLTGDLGQVMVEVIGE